MTAALDALRFSGSAGGSVPPVAYLSVASVWLAVHSLGFALHDGTLDRHGRTLAVGGLGAAGALVLLGPYPTSMVGLPGAPISNMSPPTLALLAHAFWLTGLVVLLRPALRRRLAASPAWTAVVAANGFAMTAFLWHLTALFGVLAVAPRPITGSRDWWLTRPGIVVGTVLGTVVLVVAFRRFERPTALPQRSPSVAAAGAASSALGLLAISATGAIGVLSGRTARLAVIPVTPLTAALLLAAGCLLSGVPGRRQRVGVGHVAERP
ncbi:MAG TPA: hypothetical protein VLR26_13695 [Frankiaceae bacterium]|nr:hypothetical protein [Frankiaceae bacterium]